MEKITSYGYIIIFREKLYFFLIWDTYLVEGEQKFRILYHVGVNRPPPPSLNRWSGPSPFIFIELQQDKQIELLRHIGTPLFII